MHDHHSPRKSRDVVESASSTSISSRIYGKNFSFAQSDENDIAQLVILHEPSLVNWMGSIHPNGSLYEYPVDVKAAKREHRAFKRELEKHGCTVLNVREILSMDADDNIVARVALEELANNSIQYKLVGDTKGLTETDIYLLSEEYKRKAVDKMNVDQLVDCVLTNPTIHLMKADKDTELLAVDYTFKPLVNLVFTRDQQITTRRGIVMARLSSKIRAPEVRVMKWCFQKLGFKIVGEVPAPGTLEGGDFFPAGEDICFIGVGLRSNMFAMKYLMDNDLLGTKKVAIVKDYFDQHQQRMHLDTICNIIGPKTMLILETVMGKTSPWRRLVDEYVKNPKDGKYYLNQHDVEFTEYLTKIGYNLIPVTEQNQQDYGCNGLNLGNNTIIAVDKDTAKRLAKSPHFDGRIVLIDFRNMTNMYGSVHCCSQVVSRKSLAGGQTSIELASDLCRAAATGNIERVRKLILTSGVDVNAGDYDKRTALHLAASEGHLNIVRMLINDFNANINALDRWNHTPLEGAQLGGKQDVIEFLKLKGAKTGLELEAVSSDVGKESHISGIARRYSSPTAGIDTSGLFDHKPHKQGNTARQSSNVAFMVAPCNFSENPITAADNPLMERSASLEHELTYKEGPRIMRGKVLQEFANLHRILTNDVGMDIHLFTHEAYEEIPEAVFIDDWFSTHSAAECGEPTLVLYPLKAPNRQNEKRPEMIDYLMDLYGFQRCINLATPCEKGELRVEYAPPAQLAAAAADNSSSNGNEKQQQQRAEGIALENGSLVLDRINKIAYVALSARCNLQALELWASELGYTLVHFKAYVHDNIPVHHTKVMLCIGTQFVIFCAEAIRDPEEREKVRDMLHKSPAVKGTNEARTVIEISLSQLERFCANVAEVRNARDEPVLVMSDTAYNAFTDEQLAALTRVLGRDHIVHTELSFLEQLGGGSVAGVIGQLMY